MSGFLKKRENRQSGIDSDQRISDDALRYAHALRLQEPEINLVGDAWLERKWRPSAVIGALMEGFGADTADVKVQEVKIPFETASADKKMATKVLARLDEALSKTPTWRSFGGKNVLAYSHSKTTELRQSVRPMRPMSWHLGFNIVMLEDNPVPHLMLRIPDELHASATPDMQQCLREVENEIVMRQRNRHAAMTR